MKKLLSAAYILIVILMITLRADASFGTSDMYLGQDKYQQYIIETDLPDNFVTSEQVSAFGQFFRFIIIDTDRNGEIDDNLFQYAYSFDYQGNCKQAFTLYITNDPNYGAIKKITLLQHIPLTARDMRDLGVGLSLYRKHGLEYVYRSDGKLQFMTWVQNGVKFHLVVPTKWTPGYYDYPYPEDDKTNIINRLLSKNYLISSAAFLEVTSIIALHSNIPMRMLAGAILSVTGIILSSSIAVCAIYVISRGRKRLDLIA